jgi:DNA replication and repair protein RecF
VRIERVTLRAVRTWERLTFEPSALVTVLAGPNGVGKTNLLEACAVVLSGASPRTSSELRLIRDGEQAARIAAQVRVGDAVHERDVVFEAGKGKQLRVDGSVVRSVDAYAHASPVVTFLPERLLVIRGAPQRRRAIVDQLLRRLVPGAAQVQRRYAAAVQQRNSLLRRARLGHEVSDQLAPWTKQLVELGSSYRAQRADIVARLAPAYAARFEQLTEREGATFEEVLRGSEDLAGDAESLAASERRRGSTLFGPHLDDLLPRLEGRDLRSFGSAGEQRAALLAFTFASFDLVRDELEVVPVVLLDEPWSELDANRRERLSSLLSTLGQVIVTSTEPPSHLSRPLPEALVLGVSCGELHPWHAPSDTRD